MVNTVKVLESGEVIIPKSIIESLGILRGDNLFVFQKNGRIILQKEDESFKDWDMMIAYSLDEFWNNEEDAKWTQEVIKANGLSIKGM